ncbi:MAG: tetratricopeptide repeat protein [Firmicutes bacterium]|nr:tetratricopeptide repeat protein [Bacillota bacterium]
MNKIKLNRKLLALLIIIPIITLAFGPAHQAQCLAEENGSYQGKAVSLYKKVIGGSEFQSYIDLAAKQADQFVQFGMEFREPQIWDAALSIAVNELALQHELSKHGSELKVTKEEAEAFIGKFLHTEAEVEVFMITNGYTSKTDLVNTIIKDLEYQKLFLFKAREFKMEVPEAEVRAELERITVRHILIGFTDSDGKTLRTSDQALARADEVYRKVIAGGDFEQLVLEYTDDPGTRATGGVIGPMSLADFVANMVGEFTEGALALSLGEVSKPVKSQFGYHIIRMDQQGTPEGDQYLAEYKEVEDELLFIKVTESPELNEWMDQLFKEAREAMIILDPALRAYRLSNQEKWAEAAKYYRKALKTKYYAKKWAVYLDAANAYLMLQQRAKALKVLEKVAVEAQNTSEYQDMLQRAHGLNE